VEAYKTSLHYSLAVLCAMQRETHQYIHNMMSLMLVVRPASSSGGMNKVAAMPIIFSCVVFP